jgi:predicted ATPase
VRYQACHVFTLLGAPGIGKSRLAREFLATLGGEATVSSGRCLAYGDGITYWPLEEILRELGGEAELVRRLRHEPNATQLVNDVFSGIGPGEGANRPEETSRAVRKLFEALARERPLTVLLDDLQWAEPTFLDLVEHIAVLSRDAPIMLLCLARPELLDHRPRWGEGQLNTTTLRLDPLTDDEAEALMANLLEGARLDDDVRQRIAYAAAGNPLFVEQMLAMLSESSDGDVAVPPSIQALLAARLDRLEPVEGALLECASIIGNEFWHRTVTDLGAEPAVLPGLVRKELIAPHRSTTFTTDDAYQFRHDLIRDAAYAEIAKERRAGLHERCAVWMEQHLSEHDEIVGYHLEQAHCHRTEVGQRRPGGCVCARRPRSL